METGGSPRDSCCLYVGDMIPLPFAHSASASAEPSAQETNNRSDDRGMRKSQSAGEGEQSRGSVLPLGPGRRKEGRDRPIGDEEPASPRAPDGFHRKSHPVPPCRWVDTRTEWNGKNGRTSGRRARLRPCVCSWAASCGWCISSGQRMAWHPKSAARRRGELAAAAEQDVRAPRTVQRNRLLAAATGQTE